MKIKIPESLIIEYYNIFQQYPYNKIVEKYKIKKSIELVYLKLDKSSLDKKSAINKTWDSWNDTCIRDSVFKMTKKIRPSPSESATLFPIGKLKKGNDGKMWKVTLISNNQKRWIKSV